MTAYLIAALVILAFTFVVRQHWLNYHLNVYAFNLVYYTWKKQLTPDRVLEMEQIWPRRTIMLDLFHWDFGRYVVHQDHYEEMQRVMAEELQLTDSQLASELNRRDTEDRNDPLD